MQSITDLLRSLEAASLAAYIKESPWAFPTIESFHVIAAALVVGTIAIVDLRLLGLASTGRGFTELSRDVLPWTWGALHCGAHRRADVHQPAGRLFRQFRASPEGAAAGLRRRQHARVPFRDATQRRPVDRAAVPAAAKIAARSRSRSGSRSCSSAGRSASRCRPCDGENDEDGYDCGRVAMPSWRLASRAQDAPPKDTIFARKILMDTINNNMDELEGMIASGKDLDLKEAREHAARYP